jgi:hypothetical protein
MERFDIFSSSAEPLTGRDENGVDQIKLTPNLVRPFAIEIIEDTNKLRRERIGQACCRIISRQLSDTSRLIGNHVCKRGKSRFCQHLIVNAVAEFHFWLCLRCALTGQMR